VRPVDDSATTVFRADAAAALPAHGMDVLLYESLPSLELCAVEDEPAFEDRSADVQTAPRESTPAPAARHQVLRESGEQLRDEVYGDGADRRPSMHAVSPEPARHDEPAAEQVQAGPIANEESYGPPLPVIPSGFVVGVQPLRPPASPPSAARPPYAPAPMYTPAHGVAPAPGASAHSIAPAYPVARSSAVSIGGSPQAVTGGVDPRSKLGRFAWFVFGAAFGIVFAFVATGFAPHLGKKEDAAATSAPAAMTVATPARIVPAVTAPPAAETVIAPPPIVAPVPVAPVVTAPIVVPSFIGASPVSPPTGVIAAAPPVAAPARTAAPRVVRSAPAGRRDEAPAPARPAPANGDGVGDLLNAGLGP
jgi:hypothetical protein